jgi:hypothetical protein
MTRDDADVPGPFQRALEAMRAAVATPQARSGLLVESMPAPQRLAPYAAALFATAYMGDDEVGVGRLIVLYDPDGQPGWAGQFRIVAYIRSDLEPEIATDPLLGPVGWSWLTEALDQQGAGHVAASGTITRAVSESFGDKDGDPTTTELELRASWSPSDDDISPHIAAWCDVLCTSAGLPPAGVSTFPPQPSDRGSDVR